jgi:hypothetical protein
MRSHEKKVCDDCLNPINEDKGYALIAGALICLPCLRKGDATAERILREKEKQDEQAKRPVEETKSPGREKG